MHVQLSAILSKKDLTRNIIQFVALLVDSSRVSSLESIDSTTSNNTTVCTTLQTHGYPERNHCHWQLWVVLCFSQRKFTRPSVLSVHPLLFTYLPAFLCAWSRRTFDNMTIVCIMEEMLVPTQHSTAEQSQRNKSNRNKTKTSTTTGKGRP